MDQTINNPQGKKKKQEHLSFKSKISSVYFSSLLRGFQNNVTTITRI